MVNLVRMKNRRGISQHFSSTHRRKMTNRSKTEVMDSLQYVAGGEELLVDNSFHFYMVEPFLCNVQVIASYLSTILMLPPLQTYSCLDPTQQRNLLLQTKSHLVGHRRVSIDTTTQKSFSWTQNSVNRNNCPEVIKLKIVQKINHQSKQV